MEGMMMKMLSVTTTRTSCASLTPPSVPALDGGVRCPVPSAGLAAPSVDVNRVPVWTFIPAGAVSPRLLRVPAVPLVLLRPPPSLQLCLQAVPASTDSHRMNK